MKIFFVFIFLFGFVVGCGQSATVNKVSSSQHELEKEIIKNNRDNSNSESPVVGDNKRSIGPNIPIGSSINTKSKGYGSVGSSHPCADGGCKEIKYEVPPEDQWCQLGYISCFETNRKN